MMSQRWFNLGYFSDFNKTLKNDVNGRNENSCSDV